MQSSVRPYPSCVGNLKALTSLSISSSNISGTIPPQAGSLSSIQTLDLSSNLLAGGIPPEIGSANHNTLALSDFEKDS